MFRFHIKLKCYFCALLNHTLIELVEHIKALKIKILYKEFTNLFY